MLESTSASRSQLLRGLRAVADSSRLRLLGLLALGEFTVSELTEILDQSQPRVSRHLRVMREAGLLERFREQHWVYHRLAADESGAGLAKAVLELLDPYDPEIALDRERAAAVLAHRRDAGPAVAETADEDEELAKVVAAELSNRQVETLLYLGPAPGTMLGALAPRARKALGLSDSRKAVQRARLTLHGAGLAHCVLQQGVLQSLRGGTGDFDVVVVDRILAGHERPERVLADAVHRLHADGQLLLVEDYEALAAGVADGNPLPVLRGWISRGDLRCERIRPVDTGVSHLLLGIAERQGSRAAA